MKRPFLLFVTGLTVGCASDQLYRVIGSPDPMGPPVRYPLDYPVCSFPDSGGTIYAPLKIRINHTAGFPSPERLMALRDNNPSDDGCFANRKEPGSVVVPYIIEQDWRHANSVSAFRGLDKTGRGYSTSTSYAWELFNEEQSRKEAESEDRVRQHDENNKLKFGYYYPDVIDELGVLDINGREWRHRILKRCKTAAGAPPDSGQLLAWYEQYEHEIDDAHFIRYTGRYNASVVADPEWLAARRQLLRRLVEGLQIHPVTQEEIDVARATHARRRAIDKKCGSDDKCREREEAAAWP